MFLSCCFGFHVYSLASCVTSELMASDASALRGLFTEFSLITSAGRIPLNYYSISTIIGDAIVAYTAQLGSLGSLWCIYWIWKYENQDRVRYRDRGRHTRRRKQKKKSSIWKTGRWIGSTCPGRTRESKGALGIVCGGGECGWREVWLVQS
jgi:hypothetical protein